LTVTGGVGNCEPS